MNYLLASKAKNSQKAPFIVLPSVTLKDIHLIIIKNGTFKVPLFITVWIKQHLGLFFYIFQIYIELSYHIETEKYI